MSPPLIPETERSFRYVLEVLLGEEANAPAIREGLAYGAPDGSALGSSRLVIVPGGLFGESYGDVPSLPACPAQEIEGIPLLYGQPRMEHRHGRLLVYADIIASAYFLVTRYEEMVRSHERDRWGRFPGRLSFPNRAGFLNRPVVEEYGLLLRRWLSDAGIPIRPAPSRTFSITLTHDVDHLRKYTGLMDTIRGIASARFRKKDLLRCALTTTGLVRDPYDTFDTIRGLNQEIMELKNSETIYFFMPSAAWNSDASYSLSSPIARRLLDEVRRSGAEVGLHSSREAGLESGRLAEEARMLEAFTGRPPRMHRSHCLAFNNIDMARELADAGIETDLTLGYADLPGFRLGVCHPIPLFDPMRQQHFGIEERPLVVMDSTLHRPDYMGLDEERAFELTRDLCRQVRRHSGDLVLLWHNSSWDPLTSGYHRRLYARILTYIKEELAPEKH